MWLYYFLDILSTISETFVVLVITECFCKVPRFPKNISRIILTGASVAFVICLTFFTDLGALKMFAVLSVTIALIKLCYQISFHESLIITEMSFVIMSILPESAATALMSFIYNGDITNTIGNIIILKWELYVLSILFRCICLAAAYYLLRNFRYCLQRKDALVLTVGFLLAFSVSFASVYGYLNLQREDTLILDLATSILGVYFIMQFLYTKNVSFLREQEQKDKMQIAQLNRQFDYYQEKLRDEEKVRSIYHDMKNHLLVLEGKLKLPETAAMIQKLQSQVAMYEDYVHTGSDILDIILKEKSELSREKRIVLSVTADLSGMEFIEPLDISTIFGNGLDNAIEASEKLPDEQKAILVKAGRVHNFFFVLIENNCLQECKNTKRPAARQDDFLHGFGISNMKKAAGKYGGQLTTNCENGRFALKILIPIP